jgi:hypothetical protein
MPAPSVQDRTEIYELYARYSWALDTGDTDGYVALFTADAEATEETRSGELEVRQGRAEIRKLVLKFHDRADFPGHQHQMAQFVFEPDPQARPGPRSTTRRHPRICTGAATSATSWRRSTGSG